MFTQMLKRALCVAFLFLIIPRMQAGDVVRLMSYNVRNARGLDDVRNCQRIANVINNARPDVVAVQELDSVTNRSDRTDVLRELGERTQMHSYFAPAIDYDGGKYGIGLLTKTEPLSIRRLPLPGREEARAMIIAEFDRFLFACTHLSLTKEDREKSLAILKAEAAKSGKQFFLAGDFNAEGGSEFIKELKKDFRILSDTQHPTFPADKPVELLDYIVASKHVEPDFVVKSAQVINEPVASDHRPTIVELRFATPAENIFRTQPYLQNPLDNGITVMWQTRVPAHCWVEYGTDRENVAKARTLLEGQEVCNNTVHKIRLNSLQPGQTYYYRVCSQEILLYQAYKKVFGHTACSEWRQFTMPAEGTDRFTAIVFNDLHQQARTLKALCDRIKDIDYDFVVFNGDCVDDPADHDQATAFISELTEAVGGDRVPVFFMRGNHEIRNAFSVGLHSLYDYPGGKTYGAFNWGDTRIVMLDCGEDKPDDHWVYYGLNDFTQFRKDQVAFLERELATKDFRKANKRVLIHHIPLYGNDTEYNPCRELWGGLLSKAPFNVSLNAHTHRYAYHPKGSLGNNYPVIIGGGYSMDSATVMVLEKRKNELRVKVLDTKGKVVGEYTF